jgi:hypothetical protein
VNIELIVRNGNDSGIRSSQEIHRALVGDPGVTNEGDSTSSGTVCVNGSVPWVARQEKAIVQPA